MSNTPNYIEDQHKYESSKLKETIPYKDGPIQIVKMYNEQTDNMVYFAALGNTRITMVTSEEEEVLQELEEKPLGLIVNIVIAAITQFKKDL